MLQRPSSRGPGSEGLRDPLLCLLEWLSSHGGCEVLTPAMQSLVHVYGDHEQSALLYYPCLLYAVLLLYDLGVVFSLCSAVRPAVSSHSCWLALKANLYSIRTCQCAGVSFGRGTFMYAYRCLA